jgi:hypothetical protein
VNRQVTRIGRGHVTKKYRMMKIFKSFAMMVLFLTVSSHAWAAHPLITDDSGTQGRGRFQLEVNGQYDTDKKADTVATVRTTEG